MQNKILNFLSVALLLAQFLLVPSASAATNDPALCAGDALAQLFCSTDLVSSLNSMFQLAIVLGGILAMLRISWAGWLYMGSGIDNWTSKDTAKRTFRDAILGLLILLAIWLILNLINPDILKLNLFQSMNAV